MTNYQIDVQVAVLGGVDRDTTTGIVLGILVVDLNFKFLSQHLSTMVVMICRPPVLLVAGWGLDFQVEWMDNNA